MVTAAEKAEQERQEKFNKTKSNGLADKTARGPSVSVGGYFIGMGLDSDKYGEGAVTIMQGKNMLVKLSYVDFQKIDTFMTQNAEVFNKQIDKELAVLQSIKKRGE